MAHAHRKIELSAVLLFPPLFIIFLYQSVSLLAAAEMLWLVFPMFFLGWLAGDWITGFVHWLCDTYGDENMPVFGQSIIHPFREHHTSPRAICEHDFIETNGNAFLLGVTLLVPMILVMAFSKTGDVLAPAFGIFFIFMATFSILANQVHKWSHLPPEEVSGLLRLLQRTGMILDPGHHQRHHNAPHDSHYCISCGWMNPILDRIRFWRLMEFLFQACGCVNRRLYPDGKVTASDGAKHAGT